MSVKGLLLRWGAYSDGTRWHQFKSGGDITANGLIAGKTVVTTTSFTLTALTLTAAQLRGGYVKYDPIGDSRTVVLPTGTLLDAAFRYKNVGTSIEFIFENIGSVGEIVTLSILATGNTLSPTHITLDGGEAIRLLAVRTGTGAWTFYGLSVVGGTAIDDVVTVNTVSTVGAGTYTAAHIMGGVILRDPAGAARTDTLSTGTLLQAAMPLTTVGAAVRCQVKNISDADNETITLAGAVGTDLIPATVVIRPGEVATLLFVTTGTNTYDVFCLGVHSTTGLVQANLEVATMAGNYVAATETHMSILVNGVYRLNPDGSNRTFTTPTAAVMIAGMSLAADAGGDINFILGTSFRFSIENTGVALATITLTAGNADVTLSVDDAAIYPGQTKEYEAIATSATTVTIVEKAVTNPVQTKSFVVLSPAALAANDILNAKNLVNEVMTAPGDFTSLPVYARTLKVTIVDTGASIVIGTVTIVGTDQDGVTISEELDCSAGAGTYDTTKAFLTITTVTTAAFDVLDGGGDETIAIGSNDVFGLPTRPNGMLTSVFAQLQNAINAGALSKVTVGTVDEENRTVIPANPSDAQLGFTWLYKYC